MKVEFEREVNNVDDMNPFDRLERVNQGLLLFYFLIKSSENGLICMTSEGGQNGKY